MPVALHATWLWALWHNSSDLLGCRLVCQRLRVGIHVAQKDPVLYHKRLYWYAVRLRSRLSWALSQAGV
jgi:hypothetical protein